jgi:SAM-dependent methyltransferase
MTIVSGAPARWILNRYTWHDLEAPATYTAANKLETLCGSSFWKLIRGKRVLDFGCGHGEEAMAIAERGAARVVGVDIRSDVANEAERRRSLRQIANCVFATEYSAPGSIDVIVSIDSFEHFPDPAGVLGTMASLLAPGGIVVAAFGWPWFHPNGSHFPLFPWAHLVLSESDVMAWRSRYKTDGARRYTEIEGGLNGMSIRRLRRLVAASPLEFRSFETVPIRAVRWLHCRLTREFFTAVVRFTLAARRPGTHQNARTV